jgi:hypothetical protein
MELTSMKEVATRRQEDILFVEKGLLVCRSLELYKRFPDVWKTDEFLNSSTTIAWKLTQTTFSIQYTTSLERAILL